MIKGTPFDAPLYEIDEERGVEARNAKAVAVLFTLKRDLSELIPEGLKSLGVGAVWIAQYDISTIGAFKEFVSLIQVEDEVGDRGFYMPYGYVNTDAALAASREIIGAPKKLAKIELTQELDLMLGILERPVGKRLVTVIIKPTTRVTEKEILESFLTRPTYMYSLRYTPPSRRGEKGTAHLIKWYITVDIHRDAAGDMVAFMGPASVIYDSPSVHDPVHKLEVDAIITAAYIEFDLKINAIGALREFKI
jgi:acetoacetate decarboxylase